MKKVIACLIVAIVVIASVSCFTACFGGATVNPNAYSFVTLDINPSVELITLGDNVVDVKAGNYDACVLLDGEDFSSMTLEEATSKIVALAEEMGYLNDTNNQVKISVISDDAQAIEILKNKAKSGAQKGSKKAEPVMETRLQDELTLKKLKEVNADKFAGLTEEKVRLIESVMEYDSSMTYEIGATMTVKELSVALKSALSENKDIFTQELRIEYSSRYTAKKQEIEREIATVYGEEYLADWEKYTALENIYNSIVNAIEKSGLTDDDIATVVELLQITDVSLIEKGGVVKPEYVLNYIDKHISKKGSSISQSAIDSAVKILDEYDIAKHVLTQDEIEAIIEALDEDAEFTLLSQVAENLTQRKNSLDNMKNAIELTEEKIAQIRQLEESFASIKEEVLSQMQDTIEAVRAEITAEKKERGSID